MLRIKMPKIINLIGDNFGKLIVLTKNGKDKCGNIKYDCLCTCGTITNVPTQSLKNGATKSCGQQKCKQSKHGFSNTPEYFSWRGMIRRCEDTTLSSYNNYGGRGIVVCQEWKNIATFVKDMGPKPKYSTLDRINNNKNYEKNNCKWSTPKEQSRNKRNNINITYNNKTMCLTDWALSLNLSVSGFRYRFKHWHLNKAMIPK